MDRIREEDARCTGCEAGKVRRVCSGFASEAIRKGGVARRRRAVP